MKDAPAGGRLWDLCDRERLRPKADYLGVYGRAKADLACPWSGPGQRSLVSLGGHSGHAPAKLPPRLSEATMPVAAITAPTRYARSRPVMKPAISAPLPWAPAPARASRFAWPVVAIRPLISRLLAIAVPKTIPRLRIIARKPLATPYRSRGTAPITELTVGRLEHPLSDAKQDEPQHNVVVA